MRSTDVWVLPDIDVWRDSFIEMIENIHSYSDLCSKLTASRCNALQDDDADVLSLIISEVKGHECDFIELLAREFRGRYSFVRAVHASRPTDIKVILEKGLTVFAIEDYYQMAETIFLSDCYPLVSAEDVRRAADEVISKDFGRTGKLYFYLTELGEQCAHYYKFGSEFMLSVACSLGAGEEYVKNSMKNGVPTIFVCNVPVASISDRLIFSLLRIAVCYLFKSSMENLASLKTKDASIYIECELNPLNIVDHIFPLLKNRLQGSI